ncbi:hypothetical protein [Paenibacillus sp. Marseille-Q4541]|uniref:hypothetical protein n=1 Tax=Paenibacillus sp. Marseille-Q4541 TaxID=2831522 RepID=UPI001BA48C3C|nr:hypothetical protein [Paenibacillus sp. Marseille-Q4541]
MNLLDWLLSNIYFVFVIAFALFSFLGKSRKSRGENEPQRQPSRESTHPSQYPADQEQSREVEYHNPYDTPATESRETQREERGADRRYGEQQPYPNHLPSTATPSLSSNEDIPEYEVMEQRRRELETERVRLERIHAESEKAARAARLAAASRLQTSSQKNEDHEALFMDPSDVRKGIIWAEVLGPPRAKRPFHSRNKY